jgi:hypothetical protein
MSSFARASVIRFTAFTVFLGFLVLPARAAAWGLYNLTTTINYQVFDTDFKPIPASLGLGSLSAGASAECN